MDIIDLNCFEHSPNPNHCSECGDYKWREREMRVCQEGRLGGEGGEWRRRGDWSILSGGEGFFFGCKENG